jgi:hypothetical protein
VSIRCAISRRLAPSPSIISSGQAEPARDAPDQRAVWYEAFAALGPAGQPDVRAMPDGRLWLLRDVYAAETAWAPRHVGKELRLSQLGAFDAGLGAIRADAETAAARKAGDRNRAGRHETLAASYRALRDIYQQREQALARPRLTGRNGSAPPNSRGAWPSLPTPNYADAIRARRSSPYAPPNQSLPATPDASNRIQPLAGNSPRWRAGLAT